MHLMGHNCNFHYALLSFVQLRAPKIYYLVVMYVCHVMKMQLKYRLDLRVEKCVYVCMCVKHTKWKISLHEIF